MGKFSLLCALVQKLQNMSHLTVEQRYTIEVMKSNGYKQKDIAKAIGKDKSVVSRELKRNRDKRSGEYRHDLAQRKYCKRQREKPKLIRFTPEVQQRIEGLLMQDYSPEQVVGTLKKGGEPTVSVERIYQHVWADKKRGGTLHTHLRSQGKRYRKRGSAKDNRGIIKNRVGIEQRPEIVESRERFGDLEVDLIIGKNHKQAILTINDRASGVLRMSKVEYKQADAVCEAIVEELADWASHIKTITSDNGKEFALHEMVADKLGIDYFFARPYHSWERGSNENLNGLIRQYFKKSTDFTKITHEKVKRVEARLNKRPRKRFDYENPIFVMNKLLFNQKLHL